MATQAQVDSFNAAIASGNFGLAADIAAGAGYGAADVEAYIEANAGNLGFDPGIDIPSDVVASYFDAPPVSYGPPSPAVSPVVSDPISLTPAGIAALAPSANVSLPANVFSPADYGPPSPPPAAPPTASPAEIQRMQAQRAEAELLRLREAERPIVDPRPQPAVDPVAQKYVNDFNALINQGNYEDAARLVKSAELAGYGEDAYRAAAVALDANTNLPPELNFLNAEGIQSIRDYVNTATAPPAAPAPVDPNVEKFNNLIRTGNFKEAGEFATSLGFTPEQIRSYLNDPTVFPEFGGGVTSETVQSFVPKPPPAATVTPEGAAAPPTAQTTPGPGQIYGIPRFERQAQSNVTFAPLRRGLAQLRPAMSMPGLTSGRPAFGGAASTPGQPIAAETAFALPEDFALQTGAYGAPIANPITLTPPTSISAPTPDTSFEGQLGYLANTYLGRPLSASELSTYRKDFGSTLNEANINDFLSRSQKEMANRLLVGTNPGGASSPAPDLNAVATNAASSVPLVKREGGTIKMAEGGAPPKMAELSAKEAGSTFNIADYIDDQGRLVGGYSKPIYDENRVITGYEYRPYERDVVFGEELREKEAALRPTDEEREQMMVEMAMRQGRTGIDPRVGGLAAIPMYARNLGMDALQPAYRNRPSYYAKGGIADVAQDLADKGRFGDTMVAHISPQEAGLLKAMGGAGTINPETGLPEFFELFPKRGIKLNLGPLGNIKIGRKSSDLLLAAAAGYAGATGFMGLNPATAAIGYGGVRAAATGNLQEGIMAGLSAYGMGEGMQAYGVGSPAATTGTAAPSTGSLSGSPAGVGSQQVPVGVETVGTDFVGPTATGAPTASGFSFDAAGEMIPTGTGGPLPGPEIITPTPTGGFYGKMPLDAGAPVAQAGTEAAKQGYLRSVTSPATQEYIPDFLLDASGTALATGTLLGSSLIAGQQERSGLAAAQAEEDRKRREKIERYRQLAASTLGQVRTAKAGGLMKLAGGGMTYMEAGGTTGPTGTPRDVTGTGDGMSDSVPATIEGVQEARLADGEFVIPADVVADIGNGSSDAGSKKLYDMMDRVRKARHGTTEQPPEIKAERLMPA